MPVFTITTSLNVYAFSAPFTVIVPDTSEMEADTTSAPDELETLTGMLLTVIEGKAIAPEPEDGVVILICVSSTALISYVALSLESDPITEIVTSPA